MPKDDPNSNNEVENPVEGQAEPLTTVGEVKDVGNLKQGGDQFGNGAPQQLSKAQNLGVFAFLREIGGSISWVLIGIGVLIAFICSSIIGEKSIIGKLSDPSVARGFLTYVIVLSFVGMLFMLGYQAFIVSVAEDQFRRAREVFTSLTGVLGTIVGFHFGIQDSGAETLVVKPRVTETQYIAHVTTGTAPYTYSLRSEPSGLVDEVREQQSSDGWIMAPLKSAEKPGKILLEIQDHNGTRHTESTIMPGKEPPPKTPPADNMENKTK